ncbi:sulfotransferase family protein [Peristeroidobacter soli]|uniref:sulfotransferase family protein n=1 Tax=Peristeroidobacter soli TaxID=2497877 RepID=UPI00101BA240|nr:sulfotransferase family protein [Peristeroidobacter soli]
MARQDIILILGSGRSGSSALARVLSLCGCSLPALVFGADEGNRRGFWEPAVAANHNLDFLQRQGWFAANSIHHPLSKLSCCDNDREEYIAKIREFLATCAGDAPLIIKEPLIDELTDFWFEAARDTGLSIKIVITIRPPHQVFASGRKFASELAWTQHPLERQSVWWLRTNLLVERQSRNHQRVFVDYINLMKDWRVEINRVSRALSVDLRPDEAAIDRFMSRDLHRQRSSASQNPETFASSWIQRSYDVLSKAAQGEPLDLAQLEEISREFSKSEPAQRELLAGIDLQPLREYFGRRPVWRAGVDY